MITQLQQYKTVKKFQIIISTIISFRFGTETTTIAVTFLLADINTVM